MIALISKGGGGEQGKKTDCGSSTRPHDRPPDEIYARDRTPGACTTFKAPGTVEIENVDPVSLSPSIWAGGSQPKATSIDLARRKSICLKRV